MTKNAIYGLSGAVLTADETKFLQKANPIGIILFNRNIIDKEQTKKLIADAKTAAKNEELNIFIDQEGGRVARIKQPLFSRELPNADKFSQIYELNSEQAEKLTYLNHLLIGLELKNEWGINGCFAPVVDLRFKDAHEVIGDRSFGENPDQVIKLGQAAYNGLKDAGVIACIKHLPGHGRALADSHEELPVITADLDELLKTDFRPFKEIKADFAMAAHVVTTALDKNQPITYSKQAIDYIKQNIFSGLIVSDALEMKALSGSFYDRAKKTVEAGIDILLHCSGNLEEMEQVAKASVEMDPLKISLLQHVAEQNYDFAKLNEDYNNLMQDYNVIA